MYIFCLGREYKLSIAEILAVFPMGNTIYFDKEILIIDNIWEENFYKLWGTKKIIKVSPIDILEDALKTEWKFKYWINVFPFYQKNLKNILHDTKKAFKNASISSRYLNIWDINLSSAQILGEKLLKRETDYNFVFTKDKKYTGKTIWVQDIDSYSKRDYSKDRDMQIGMLPPKLAQMMINIWGDTKSVYDPFVWLGTILIEASLLGFKKLYGSDLNERMVSTAEKNLKKFIKDNNIIFDEIWFEKLNAKFVWESKFLNKEEVDLIVTEWYLWEVMTKNNISLERIEKQKESLRLIYKSFFENLAKINYSWKIIICFPFWDLNDKYVYLNEVYSIIEKYCDIELLFPTSFENLSTKAGSLLYKRDKQLVWREIFKLSLK